MPKEDLRRHLIDRSFSLQLQSLVNDDTLLDGYFAVAIDERADPDKALVMLRNLLKKRLKPRTDFRSGARYSPSKEAKYIKLNVLRRYRLVYTLKELEGKTRKQIAPELLRLRKSKQLPTLRVITRDLTAAKQILDGVKKGVFPSA